MREVARPQSAAGKLLLPTITIILVLFCAGLGSIWYIHSRRSIQLDILLGQTLLTYGPTLLILPVISLWRPIDYALKTNTPWSELYKGQVSADKSVLLDYVSSFQGETLLKASKHRHWNVILSILGFVCLKIATVASTGLLIRDRQYVDFPGQTISFNTTFDGTLYNASDFSILQDKSVVYGAYSGWVDDQPHAFLFDTLQMQSVDYGTKYEFYTNGVQGNTTCDLTNVSITIEQNSTDVNPSSHIVLNDDECEPVTGSIYTLNPARYRCPNEQLSGTIHQATCRNTTYQLLIMTKIEYEQQLAANTTISSQLGDRVSPISWQTNIVNISAALCRPSYSKGMASVKVVGQTVYGPDVLLEPGKLVGFDDNDLATALHGELAAASSMFGNLVDNTYVYEYPHPLIKLMEHGYGNLDPSYNTLIEGGRMHLEAANAYDKLTLNYIDKHLRKPATNTLISTFYINKSVLKISLLSFLVIVSMFGLLILICLYMQHTQNSSLRSITYDATMNLLDPTIADGNMHKHLSRSTFSSDSALSRSLDTYSFSAEYRPYSTVNISASAPENSSDHEITSSVRNWWRPLTTRRWFLLITFVFGALVICTLEILDHISRTNNGVVNYTGSGPRFLVCARYIPTIVLLLFSTMVNCIEFNVILMDILLQMRRGSHLSHLLQSPRVGLLYVRNSWRALRQGRLAVLAVMSASLVGAVLTIVVAGLYQETTFSNAQNSTFPVTDLFNLTWPDSVINDGEAGIMVSLSFAERSSQNLEYVYAFPQNSSAVQSVADRLSPILITMPVYRANLKCDLLTDANFNTSVTRSYVQQDILLKAAYKLPDNCRLGSAYGNDSYIDFDQSFEIPLGSSSAYLGKLLDLHTGPYDSIRGSSAGEVVPAGNPDNPPGCPSIALIYGYIRTDQPAIMSALSVEVCYQEIQSIDADLSFDGSDFNLNTSEPVRIHEETARTLPVNANTNETSFQFRVQSHLDDTLVLLNSAVNTTTGSLPTINGAQLVLDPFFQVALLGESNDFSPIQLLSSNTTDGSKDILHSKFLSLYRLYMAQVMSNVMRVSPTNLQETIDADTAGTIHGNVSYEGVYEAGLLRYRVTQDRKTQRTLQCMIGYMLLTTGLAVYLTEFKRVVPGSANPCTIWGQMVLWNGSKCCNAHTEETVIGTNPEKEITTKSPLLGKTTVAIDELECEKGLGVQGTYDPLLRLGWWDEQGKPVDSECKDGRYGIDIVK